MAKMMFGRKAPLGETDEDPKEEAAESKAEEAAENKAEKPKKKRGGMIAGAPMASRSR